MCAILKRKHRHRNCKHSEWQSLTNIRLPTSYKFCHCMELKFDSEWWKLKGVPWINQCIRLQHMCAMQCIVCTTFTGSDVLGEWVSVPDLVILNSVQCKVTCIDSHWRRGNARRQKDGLTYVQLACLTHLRWNGQCTPLVHDLFRGLKLVLIKKNCP